MGMIAMHDLTHILSGARGADGSARRHALMGIDLTRRRARCRDRFVLTISEDIVLRGQDGGAALALLRGTGRDGGTIFATLALPSYWPGAGCQMIAHLPIGSRVTLEGFWHARPALRRWSRGFPILEFRAQFLRHFVTAAR